MIILVILTWFFGQKWTKCLYILSVHLALSIIPIGLSHCCLNVFSSGYMFSPGISLISISDSQPQALLSHYHLLLFVLPEIKDVTSMTLHKDHKALLCLPVFFPLSLLLVLLGKATHSTPVKILPLSMRNFNDGSFMKKLATPNNN